MTQPSIMLKGAAGNGVFSPDQVRALVKQAAETFPHLSDAPVTFRKAYASAQQTAPGKPWTQCTPMERAVLLKANPDENSFYTLRMIAKSLIRDHPGDAEQITKTLMPTPVTYEQHKYVAWDDADETGLYEKRWGQLTAIEKAVQLENDTMFPGESERVAAELIRQFPEASEQIRKDLMPAMNPVRKAKKDVPPVAVYDEDGNLVGVINDPDAITPIQGAKSPAKPAVQPAQDPQAAPAAAPMPADGTQPAAKAMSLGARGHQLGGMPPAPTSGVPVVPADEAEPEEVAKARRGDFQGAGRILKARLATTYDAPTEAATRAALDHLAAAEYARIRRSPKTA